MENKDKKIIGYRFKPEFINGFVSRTLNCTIEKLKCSNKYNIDFYENSGYYNILNDLKVLDIWCEPVYEQKEKVISMNGQFDLIVKDNKVFHKNEDITKYVKEIIRLYKNLLNSSCTTMPVTGYALRIDFDSIKFLKTGCEEKLTYLKDWLNVAKEAKLI